MFAWVILILVVAVKSVGGDWILCVCILKVEPTRFADMGCEKKREKSRMVSRLLT